MQNTFLTFIPLSKTTEDRLYVFPSQLFVIVFDNYKHFNFYLMSTKSVTKKKNN